MFHEKEVINFNLLNADVVYRPNFLTTEAANIAFQNILSETSWQHDDITVFGKTYKQPRLTALFGNNGVPYSYSNITMHPEPFSGILKDLKEAIEETTGHEFTTCLVNLYRDGNDSNGWHADNEKSLGRNPTIASLSLGNMRRFKMKHNTIPNQKLDLDLSHGSLLMMSGETQHTWKHQIPKTKKIVEPRINLTFRNLKT